MAISRHIISFRFFSISGRLWTTQENQNRSIRSRRVSCNWGKIFWIFSKGKIFRAHPKKNPYIINYWWAGFSNYGYSTNWAITKIYIFLLYFTSVLLLMMQSQPASVSWTVTSTAAFLSVGYENWCLFILSSLNLRKSG